ncbi:YidC/Oxa1 family membrane protein insertase, partial [Photobacterium angustum]
MLSLLYDIFISPLIWGMNFVLVNAYSVLHSYGLAIVVLSLVVNTVLLPLYHMADKWQQEEREKQNKMADKVAEIKQAFQGQERFMMLKTLYRQNHYHPIMAVRNSVGFLIQVPFFFAAYQLLSHFPALNGQSFGPFANLGLPDGLLTIGDMHINVMPFVMTGINLLSAFIYTKGLSSKDKIQLYVFAGIFLVLLYTSPVGLVLYWTLNNVYSLGKNLVSANADNIDNSKFVSLLKAPFTFVGKAYENVVPKKIRDITIIPEIKSSLICFGSLYIIVFLIAAYVPINVYLSDPAFFHITLSDVVKYGVRTIVVTLAVFGIIYLCLSEKLKGKVTFIVTVISLISLFNVLVPLRNYGSIDGYFLTNEPALWGRKLLIIYDLSTFICVFLLCYFLTIKKVILNNKYFFIVISVILSIYVIYISFSNNINTTLKKAISNDTIPSYNNDLSSYSKSKKNIVVFMLDMFTGDHMLKIINENKNISDALNGFVYYPDTLTSGNHTLSGEIGIHGGHQSIPRNINKKEYNSITDAISKSYAPLINSLHEKSYDISLAGVQFATCNDIRNNIKPNSLKTCKDISYESDYVNYFAKKNKIKINYTVNDNDFLLVYGLFSVSPYVFRGEIYNSGQWMHVIEKRIAANNIKQYAYLNLITSISNTNSLNNTYKYIQVSSTHAPWSISNSGKITSDVQSYNQKRSVDGSIPAHYNAEKYTIDNIVNYIKWLKKNDIFDNTMIILVSDHSADDSILFKKNGMTKEGLLDFGQNENQSFRANA